MNEDLILKRFNELRQLNGAEMGEAHLAAPTANAKFEALQRHVKSTSQLSQWAVQQLLAIGSNESAEQLAYDEAYYLITHLLRKYSVAKWPEALQWVVAEYETWFEAEKNTSSTVE